ncbi:MAG: hypothetical protein M3P98_00255, partial [bacterium]|nr:hypothetical protein [bacterium]
DEKKTAGNIVQKAKSLLGRVSLTAKQTRKSYRHYQLAKQALREADANDTDAYNQALANVKDAKTHYGWTRAKATGAFALLGAGVDAVFISKGIDSSTVITGVGLGLIAPAVAVRQEKKTLGDIVSDATLSAQVKGQTFLSGLKNSMKENRLSLDELAEKDAEKHANLVALSDTIDQVEEALENYEQSDDFESDSDEHNQLIDAVNELSDRYDSEFDAAAEQYGKKKYTRNAKIAMIGALAVTGIAAYASYKFNASSDNHTGRSGGTGNATPDTTPSGSGSGNHAGTTPVTTPHSTPDVTTPGTTPSGNGSGITPPAPTAPTHPIPANPNDPFGPVIPTSDIRNNDEAINLIKFNGWSNDQREAFYKMVDGVDHITKAHPDATQAQLNQIGSRTLEFASNYDGWSPAEKADWTTFSDGIQSITASNPGATPAEVSGLVSDFLEVASTAQAVQNTAEAVRHTAEAAGVASTVSTAIGSSLNPAILAHIDAESHRRMLEALKELDDSF